MELSQEVPYLPRGEMTEAAMVGQLYLMQRIAQIDARQNITNGKGGNGRWEGYFLKTLGFLVLVVMGYLTWLTTDHLRVSQEQARRTGSVARIDVLEREMDNLTSVMSVQAGRIAVLEAMLRHRDRDMPR